MKRFLPLLVALIISTVSFGQAIDSMVVKPSSPNVNDTIRVCVFLSFKQTTCAGSAQWSQVGFNINASTLHCQGPITSPCYDVDTITLNPPHTAGLYSLTFTLSSGLGLPTCTPGFTFDDQRTIQFQVSPVTGTNTLALQNVTMFPNPANGYTTLKFDSKVDLQTVTVTDLSGKLAKCKIDLQEGMVSIDTKKLPNGIYHVNLEHNGGKTVRKLVVQH